MKDDNLDAQLMLDLYGIKVEDYKPHSVVDLAKMKNIGKKFINNTKESIAEHDDLKKNTYVTALNENSSTLGSYRNSEKRRKIVRPTVTPNSQLLLAEMKI